MNRTARPAAAAGLFKAAKSSQPAASASASNRKRKKIVLSDDSSSEGSLCGKHSTVSAVKPRVNKRKARILSSDEESSGSSSSDSSDDELLFVPTKRPIAKLDAGAKDGRAPKLPKPNGVGAGTAGSAAGHVDIPPDGDVDDVTFASSAEVLALMRVAYTGARVGDLLEGTNPVTKGALLRVCQSDILPMKRKLDEVREKPALWRGFVRQLGTITFFAGMSEGDRAAWLASNENSKERMGSEGDEALDAVRFQVLGVGKSVLGSKVDAENIELLTRPPPEGEELHEWPALDIARMIPANNESSSTTESGRHTLFFIKSWWKISSDARIVQSFQGRTIDVSTGGYSPDDSASFQATDGAAVATQSTQLFLLEGLPTDESDVAVAFRVPTGPPIASTLESLTNTHILPIWSSLPDASARAFDSRAVQQQVQRVAAELSKLAPSALRSLLQKLIRFPSRTCTDLVSLVSADQETGEDIQMKEEKHHVIDSRIVLLTASCLLVTKPMTFNPDIGRQVSGLESFLKRLGVILGEDSSFDDDGASLLSLLSGALLSQRVPSWRPTCELLDKWLRIALAAYTQRLCFRYDVAVGDALPPFKIGAISTKLHVASALLDTLRSFQGDMSLVRHIASLPTQAARDVLRFNVRDSAGPSAAAAAATGQNWHGFESLPIYHHCDQHAFPNIGYYFSVTAILRECGGARTTASVGKPYARLFARLFSQVTGANPRRTLLDQAQFESDAFVCETRQAQRALMVSELLPLESPRTVLTGPDDGQLYHELVCELDASWLPGLVGAIELKARAAPKKGKKEDGKPGRPALLTTLCCDDPGEIMVIRKPARGRKPDEAALSDEVERDAVEETRQLLTEGVVLKATRAPHESLKGCKAVWDEERCDYWIVSKNGRERTLWEEARKLKVRIPLHATISYSFERALVSQGQGMQVGAMAALSELVGRSPSMAVLSRVLYYLETYDHEIRLNRIARDGSGMEYQVNTNDTAVFRWLLRFSMIFPGALRPAAKHLSAFTVPNGPFLWTTVVHLRQLIQHRRMQEQQQQSQGAAAAGGAATGTTWVYQQWKSPFEKLWLHQTEAEADMRSKLAAGRRGHYLHSPAGSGKTMIVSMFLLYLAQIGMLPQHVVWSLPQSAVESVAAELKSFGFDVQWMMPTKNGKSKVLPNGVERQLDVKNLGKFVITLVLHDDLKRMSDELRIASDDLFFVMDEVHMALDDKTQRTSIALEVAKLSRGFVVLSGTPSIDNKIYRLLPWLALIVPFAVTLANFWCAANSLVSQIVDTGVHVITHEIEAPWPTPEAERQYRSLVPSKYGGTNNYPRRQDASRAESLCYEACTREMVRLALELLRDKLHYGDATKWKGGVFLVAENEKHQQEMKRLMLATALTSDDLALKAIRERDIFCLSGKVGIHMSDATIASGASYDYPLVITTKNRSTGYTLSRLKASITSVYGSNLAARIQLDGRLNRLSQQAKELHYYTVHAGVLTYVMQNHQHAASIDKAFRDMGLIISEAAAGED